MSMFHIAFQIERFDHKNSIFSNFSNISLHKKLLFCLFQSIFIIDETDYRIYRLPQVHARLLRRTQTSPCFFRGVSFIKVLDLLRRLTGSTSAMERAMVNFGQETDDEKKKAAFEEMLAIAKEHKVRVIECDLFDFYETWRNPVLRELAPMMPGATPSELAKKCYTNVSAYDVKQSLDFLVKAGFLKKTAENTYVQSETSITGSPEATRLAIREMHREMAKIAANALDLSRAERNFSGVTMGISKESYEQIIKELDECRRKVISIAAGDKNINQVYRLNLQLFPLTRNAKEESNG